jgi:metallophosphoesterase (TIGR00282 family)
VSVSILFIGDIMGRSGRDALEKHLPKIREHLRPDVVIVNGENAAHGRGITQKICRSFFDLNVDCITTGNHVWDQNEILGYIDQEKRLLRPANFPENTPGNGHYIHNTADGKKVVIVNLMARLFMDPLDDPFKYANDLVREYRLGHNADAIFIDFHGETTSEKMAMAQMLDGKVSAVIGTHTHLPTADMQIFNGGTGFQADAGMSGDYDSVIGIKKEIPITRFTKKISGGPMRPADGEGTVCGVYLECDSNGLTKRIEPVIQGPRLINRLPDIV